MKTGHCARWIFRTILFVLLFSVAGAHASEFYAYYTRLDYNIPLGEYRFDYGEEEGRELSGVITGRYADIVVNIEDDLQLIFGREAGYLPYLQSGRERWPLNEIGPRQPDPQCFYSYARIIESTPDRVLIHWRYMPDLSQPGHTGVAHEYFSIAPDGVTDRRVRRATARADEWHVASQQFTLSPRGITESEYEPLRLVKDAPITVEGSPVKEGVVGKPVAWLRFDEGIAGGGNSTTDAIQSRVCTIDGNLSLWKNGVSGSALAFDGYTSKVALASPESPDYLGEELTAEAWIALGALPWNDTAIVQQTNPPGARPKGYFLGLNETGHPLLRIFVEEEWHSLVATEAVDLYRWTHVTATFDGGAGEMAIYIDGEECGRKTGVNGRIGASPVDICVGLNSIPGEATRHVSEKIGDVRTPEGSQPWIFGIEGLIDEVKVYNQALSPSGVKKSYGILKPAAELRDHPDLEKRVLPGEVGASSRFGAQHKTLAYHDLWDNLWRTGDYGDVVVKFGDSPVSVVYWRAVNYGASFVTEKNLWMSDQSVEVWTWCGCSEHMSDKDCRFAHVRVIENTDARAVIHWRYASVGIMYNFPNNYAWTDEYHTIYPDGVILRKVNYYAGEAGWNDTQFLAAPGQRPEDVMNMDSVTAANLKGETYVMDWTDGIPENKLRDASIRWINFKSDYKVYVVYPGEGFGAWGDRERGDGFGIWAGPWNHWPVSQLPNDGRFAVTTDRLTHSALGGGDTAGDMALFGLTGKSAAELVPLARSWKQAPELVDPKGCKSGGYKMEERAYHLKARGEALSFRLAASEDSPVVNPCFVIRNWGSGATAALKVNGEAAAARQGIIRDTDGSQTLVLWLEWASTSPAVFEISK